MKQITLERKMNLASILVTQCCNYRCTYCTMKPWIYEEGFLDNEITNRELLPWLDKFLDPREWFIKITGGEPGLYPEINTLIPSLNERGYKGMIETNGSLPIPKTDNFIRLACWHINRPQPKYFDKILILKSPRDNWRAKIEYCKTSDIPYYSVPLLDGSVITYPYSPPTKINAILHVNSSGDVSPCPNLGDNPTNNIRDMQKPQLGFLRSESCRRCPQITMFDWVCLRN